MGCDMVEVLDNKCPACGAKIEFNPLNQMWDCEYCYSKFTLEEMKAYKNASNDAANNIPVLEVKEEKKEKGVRDRPACGGAADRRRAGCGRLAASGHVCRQRDDGDRAQRLAGQLLFRHGRDCAQRDPL